MGYNTGSWLSPATTGNPTSQWGFPDNVKVSDNFSASETRVSDKLDTSDYGLDAGLPTDAELVAIEVSVEGSCSPSGSATIGVQLSWDGGTSYTAEKLQAFSTTEQIKTYSGPKDTPPWGRTWTVSEISNANFRARLNLQALNFGATTGWVDHIQVRVYWRARRMKLEGVVKSARRTLIG